MAISSNDTGTNDIGAHDIRALDSAGARRTARPRQDSWAVSLREKASRFLGRWGGTLLTIVEWSAFTAVAAGFVLLLFALIAG